jgi:hypothetical protein
MDKSRLVTGMLAVAVIIGALNFLTPGRGEAQIGSTPVRVVNTPLPITGNVTASLPSGVNATVTGEVTISNPPNAPVPVTNVDDDKQLTQGHAYCNLTNGICHLDVTTVPVGKRLVIQHFSGNIFTPGDHNLSIVQIVQGVPGSDAYYINPTFYPLPELIGNPNGNKMYHFNRPALIYFESGQLVRFQVFTDRFSPGGFANVFFSGYLTSQS